MLPDAKSDNDKITTIYNTIKQHLSPQQTNKKVQHQGQRKRSQIQNDVYCGTLKREG